MMKFISIIIFLFTAIILFHMVWITRNLNIEKTKNIFSKEELDIEKSPHYVLISHEYDNPYWKIVKEGAEKACEESGVIIEYWGPPVADMNTYMEYIDTAIAAKVDGILMYVLNDQILTPYINNAVNNDIPVITVDTDAPDSNRNAYIGTNNYEAGVIAAKEMVRITGGKGNIGIITGDLRASNQILRIEGFQSVIKNYPNMKVVDIKASGVKKIGVIRAVTQMIEDHSSLNALYCTSALDGIGAGEVIVKKNRKDIQVVAFDDLPQTLNYIDEGIIHAAIVQKPYKMGYDGVMMMNEIMKNQTVPKVVDTGVTLIKKENVKEYIEKNRKEE